MDDFLHFFDELVRRFPLHLEIGYNKTMDWAIEIYKKGCAKDYQKSPHNGDDAVLVMESGGDMELVFARAHVALKEWLSEYEGGY